MFYVCCGHTEVFHYVPCMSDQDGKKDPLHPLHPLHSFARASAPASVGVGAATLQGMYRDIQGLAARCYLEAEILSHRRKQSADLTIVFYSMTNFLPPTMTNSIIWPSMLYNLFHYYRRWSMFLVSRTIVVGPRAGIIVFDLFRFLETDTPIPMYI